MNFLKLFKTFSECRSSKGRCLSRLRLNHSPDINFARTLDLAQSHSLSMFALSMLINVLRQVVSRLHASLIYMPTCRRGDIDWGSPPRRRRRRKRGSLSARRCDDCLGDDVRSRLELE